MLNFHMLSKLLAEDYHIQIATNGAKALDIAAGVNPPDLVLLDIMMPEMDGYEVCRRLKANELIRSIPVIFVTAMDATEDEEKGLSLGAVDYISKPFQPGIVRAWVRNQIERKRAEETMLEAQMRTATVLDSIADTFYSLDNKWRFIEVNPAAEKDPFGRPATELLGKVIWDLYPDLLGTRIHEHYLNAMKNCSLEHYESKSPLNEHWYEVFMYGRRNGIDVYMRDITERRQAEDALHQANKKLTLLSSITRHDINNQLTVLIGFLSCMNRNREVNRTPFLNQDIITTLDMIYYPTCSFESSHVEISRCTG